MSLTIKQISKKYNRFSAIYDFLERPFEKRLFSRWRKNILKDVNGRVLEVGVGTGKNLPYYNYDPVELTAVDISEGMLSKAKKLAEKYNYPVIFKLLKTDILPFNDDSFDYIICTFVLCSVPDQKKILEEMKSVLKDSGKIIFLEHVLSKNKFIAFIENLHNPITKFLFGVNINRNTLSNIKNCGLKVIKEENLALKDVFKKIEVKK